LQQLWLTFDDELYEVLETSPLPRSVENVVCVIENQVRTRTQMKFHNRT